MLVNYRLLTGFEKGRRGDSFSQGNVGGVCLRAFWAHLRAGKHHCTQSVELYVGMVGFGFQLFSRESVM